MANEAQIVFSATTTTVISHAAALANAAWTYSGLTGLTMTTLDNNPEQYPYARCVLAVPDTFAAAPTTGGYIGLYMNRINTDGTADDIPAPDSVALKSARAVGAFPIVAYDVAQQVTIDIDLGSAIECDFFIENKCGQQLSYSSGPITVKITPFSLKPAA